MKRGGETTEETSRTSASSATTATDQTKKMTVIYIVYIIAALDCTWMFLQFSVTPVSKHEAENSVHVVKCPRRQFVENRNEFDIMASVSLYTVLTGGKREIIFMKQHF